MPAVKRRAAAALPPPASVYTPGQAAELLAVTEVWLRRKTGQRRIPCTRIGKRVFFTPDDLHAIVAAAKQATGTRTPDFTITSRPVRRRRR
jgi:excisionase family DNA binding protein